MKLESDCKSLSDFVCYVSKVRHSRSLKGHFWFLRGVYEDWTPNHRVSKCILSNFCFWNKMIWAFFEAVLEGGGAGGRVQGGLHDDGHGVVGLSWKWNMLCKPPFAPTYWKIRTIHRKTKIWEPKIPPEVLYYRPLICLRGVQMSYILPLISWVSYDSCY